MAKKKKTPKAKEPIRVRFKKLANGNQSIYLDCYKDGRRTYEFLKLYLIPEVDDAAKVMNKNTLQAANAIKAARLIEITNDAAGLTKTGQRSKMLLLDWMKYYRERKAKTGQSIEFALQVDNSMKHLIKYRGDKVTLKDVDKAFCLGYIDYLNNAMGKRGKQLAKVSANGYFRCFNCALNLAVKEEVIPYNPVTKISQDQRIKVPESTREYLTIPEVKVLMDADCKYPEVKRAYLFSCFCGLRISDIYKLTWGDIVLDGEQYKVRVVMKKTAKALYLPLSATALRWLPGRGTGKDTDNVFVLPTQMLVNYRLSAWAKKAGITKRVTFHTARHTFATMELTAGADLYTTSKLLGHTNVKTTQIYAKIVDAKKAEAVNLVSNLFAE